LRRINMRAKLEERYREFPFSKCREASREVEEVLGFRIIVGYFIDESAYGGYGPLYWPHFWNNTKLGEIVDITASQFGWFPKVYITKIGSPEAKKHYYIPLLLPPHNIAR
jgi:hypothetical protein